MWCAFAVVLIVSLFFSPATSIKTLRIVGAPGFERQRMQAIAKALKGRPYLSVNRQQILSLALENFAVENASYRGNLFGRGVLSLSYRRPVASIAGEDGLFLSSKGSVFSWPVPVSLQVSVEPPYEVGSRNLSVFGSWQSGTAALMCENIGERLPKTEWRLVVSQTGFVSLVPKDGCRVEFGSFEGAEDKVKTLEDLLKSRPKLLTEVSEINLSSTRPVFVP